ncbi:hypothetical protein KP509_16G001500 [Ceratopteris richardii]|nr:hypothetical protein KP509_16G001500 [Ceratopteris richardii]
MNGGNFPLVGAEILHRRQSSSSGKLTIEHVNDYLDKLAAAENRDAKTNILSELIKKTNAHEMRWIIMFILKELKLGISEKTILHEFHPDAEDLFNVTCDLKMVSEKLKDRNQRFKRQDIIVGKPVRPQLASRVSGVEEAWKKLRGKRIVAECKFDGDRIQIHKDGNEVHFYSRSFIDHQEYTDGMSSVIINQIKVEKCILDGEMLVWNRLTNRFAEFGSNQEVARASKNGLVSDQQLCFVAFDILYCGDCSVTHQSLSERQILLKQVVQPLKGSLELLLPGNGCGLKDQPLWSMLVQSPEEINKFFLETVENRDEGIVLKDLDSKWEPGDRSGKWIKLKPDYVHAESDLDALIIGCYLRSGNCGGEIGQFLLGIAEKSRQGSHPTRFLSFCKVGSGLSHDERDVLVNKLKPYLREVGKNTKPPSFYVVTNHAKERPDFWVEQPEKSFILEITSDIRTIKSEVFAAPYSLRFPRTNRIRYDKPWYDCLDVDSLVQLIHCHNGNIGDMKEHGKPRKARVTKPKKTMPSLSLVPLHMHVTDVSHVKQESLIFKGVSFHFVNIQPPFTRDSLHKLVVENGGSFAMNLSDSVTHVIAGEKKGIKYQAAAIRKDIIHQNWVIDCVDQKVLLPLRPKYILHLSKSSKLRLDEGIDEYGDSYFEDIDADDLKQLFQQMNGCSLSVDKEDICHFQKKYCRKEGYGKFCGCRIYFHNPIHSNNSDSQVVTGITLKRLELDLLMHEGEVTSKLEDATHMIIYTSNEHPISFSNVVKSVTCDVDRNLLMAQGLHVVKHTWLEDALVGNARPNEESYSLLCGVSNIFTMTMENDNSVSHAPKLNKKRNMRIVDEECEEVMIGTHRNSSKRRLYSEKDSKVMIMNSPSAGTIPEVRKSELSNLNKNEPEGPDIETQLDAISPDTLSERPVWNSNAEYTIGSCELSYDKDLYSLCSLSKSAHMSSICRTSKGDDHSDSSLKTGNSRCTTGIVCEIFEQEIQKIESCGAGISQSEIHHHSSHVSTAGEEAVKKKKVSYRELVGNLLGL